jgi:hypothetical protein
MNIPRRLLFPLGAALILGYFLFFTWRSLFLYFDSDDLYNLYFAWHRPLREVLDANLLFWNGYVRPLGAIFYRALFAWFGFRPLPFHVAALAIGAGNIGLCFWFVRLVSQSDRTAALAALFFAFHTRLMEVWFRPAVVFDALSFTFSYLAACLYITARQGGRRLSMPRLAMVAACYILALDAKEMAVFLPILLLSYELILRNTGLKSLITSRLAVLIGLMVLAAIPYALGKLSGPTALANNPDYKPEFSFTRFSNTWSTYLEHLFVMKTPVPGWAAIAIVAALALVAALLRSRLLLFAWSIIVFGLLPVSFVPPRGAFVLFVSWPGWVLYAAALLVAAQDALLRGHPQFRTAFACLIFVLVGWRFGKINLHDQRVEKRPWLYESPALIEAMTRQMLESHPTFPRSARILLTRDSFSTDEYTPMFLMQLLYRDPKITLDRIKMMQKPPRDWDSYQYVFTYEDQAYRQLKP